eukprot:TRINITY_DN1037_c0_g1_i3.p1 TRINITY_DN1037_c0_g1~~TRINITY_DN1037_c0_g1_i3.p1  ORF type:complete len:282 (+),score=39.75 TRINITY_DN1037_c0_g1_i3:37-882(+)
MLVQVIISLSVGVMCGYLNCTDPNKPSCCDAPNQDVGECYNKANGSCAICDYYTSLICPLDTPKCCTDGRTRSCYGGTDHCCQTHGKVVNESTYCIGVCGTTQDPYEKCCSANLPTFDNRTHCCAGGKQLCETQFERCTSCGCVSVNDTTTKCCGGMQYNSDTYQCCTDLRNRKSLCLKSSSCSACGCLNRPDIEKCCYDKIYVPSSNESCCDGNNGMIVCNSTQVCMHWKNPLSDSVCCNPGWEICQGHCYDPSVNQCCGQHPGHICPNSATCCDNNKCC